MGTESFGDRLARLIESLELSRNQFGAKINVDQSRISGYIVRGKQPGVDFFKSVKTAFPDVDLNWLISDDGHMFVINANPEMAYDAEMTDIQKQEIESLRSLLDIQKKKEEKYLKEISRLKKLAKNSDK